MSINPPNTTKKKKKKANKRKLFFLLLSVEYPTAVAQVRERVGARPSGK